MNACVSFGIRGMSCRGPYRKWRSRRRLSRIPHVARRKAFIGIKRFYIRGECAGGMFLHQHFGMDRSIGLLQDSKARWIHSADELEDSSTAGARRCANGQNRAAGLPRRSHSDRRLNGHPDQLQPERPFRDLQGRGARGTQAMPAARAPYRFCGDCERPSRR